MSNLVQLDNVDHHALRVAARYGAEFGHAVNQMLVTPNEFEEAQREYPILFRRHGDSFQSVVLLGLDRDENLFLRDGDWQARCIPAEARRGPFFLGENEGGLGEPSVYVDLDDPRVSETDGESLFLSHGGNAPPLECAASALRTIHEGLIEAQPMFAAFLKSELIQPLDIEIRLDDGLEYRISEVFNVSAEQLAALQGERLEHLSRSGFLPHAIFARSSLANINRLTKLKMERSANG